MLFPAVSHPVLLFTMFLGGHLSCGGICRPSGWAEFCLLSTGHNSKQMVPQLPSKVSAVRGCSEHLARYPSTQTSALSHQIWGGPRHSCWGAPNGSAGWVGRGPARRSDLYLYSPWALPHWNCCLRNTNNWRYICLLIWKRHGWLVQIHGWVVCAFDASKMTNSVYK